MLSLVPGVFTDVIQARSETGYILSESLAIPTRLIGRAIIWKSTLSSTPGGISLSLEGAYNDVDLEYVQIDTSIIGGETRIVMPTNYGFLRVKQFSRAGGGTTTVSIKCDEGATAGVNEVSALTKISISAAGVKTTEDKLLTLQLGTFEVLRQILIEQRIMNDLLVEGLLSRTIDLESTRKDPNYISDIPDLVSIFS